MIRSNSRPPRRARRTLLLLFALLALLAGPVIAADSDGDGWDDSVDNCPADWNPFQGDYDGTTTLWWFHGQEVVLSSSDTLDINSQVYGNIGGCCPITNQLKNEKVKWNLD